MGKTDDSKSEPQFIKLRKGSAITTKTASFTERPVFVAQYTDRLTITE